MPQGNYDIERAAHDAMHEKHSKDIAKLFERLDTLMNIVLHFHPEILNEFEEFMKENDNA